MTKLMVVAGLALLANLPAQAVPGVETLPYEGDRDKPTEDCLWTSFSSDRLINFVNVDSNAVYQCTSYHLPPGAALEVKGKFPRSRYMSFTLYGNEGGDAYLDQDIVPDAGSINPSIYGNDRNARNRSYTLHLLSGSRPKPGAYRPPNTLYHAGPADPQFGNFLCVRIYVPDKGTEPFGGSGLPKVTLIQPGGKRVQGEAMCKAIDALSKGFALPPKAIGFNLNKYLALREGSRVDPSMPVRPPTHPAKNPPEFKAFFNTEFTQCSFFTPEQDCGTPTNNPDGVGLGNPLSRYQESYLDQGFGRVLVMKGKLPTTPKTWNGDRIVPKRDYQLRYFSICPQESLNSWRVGDCLFDEELAQTLDNQGFYTAVLSRPSWRPRNATPECGFAWAETPPLGDGAGDLWLYNMWIRWTLPSPNFTQGAGNVTVANTDETVMGPYYPRGTYMSVEEFEALGCRGAPTTPPGQGGGCNKPGNGNSCNGQGHH